MAKHAFTTVTRPDSTDKSPEDPRIMVKTFYFSDESALIQHLERRRALMITMNVAAPRDTVINVAHAAIMAAPYLNTIFDILASIYPP
jgi:hypothetical protein